MGIFDFFKQKKPAIENNKIKFDEIKDFISRNKSEITLKETKVIREIQNRINSLILELENEIIVIKRVDLKDRKVEEKVRLIVLENAWLYADYLAKLKENLENIKSTNLDDLISSINTNFQEFKKKSSFSLEKARFLIGKELGNVMQTIEQFYNDLNETLAENKGLIEKHHLIKKNEKIFCEISEVNTHKDNLQKEINQIDEDISKFQEKILNLKSNLEEISKSKEYAKIQQQKQELEHKKHKLDSEMAKLRSNINLREYSKIYHSMDKKMKMIKEYEQDFKDVFEKDQGKFLLEITKDETNIKKAIQEILSLKKEIAEFIIEKDSLAGIAEEILSLQDKILEENDKKTKLTKKISEFEDKIENIKKNLKSEISGLGVEMIN